MVSLAAAARGGGSSPCRQEDSWAHDGEMTVEEGLPQGHGGSCTNKDESVPRGKDQWMSLQAVLVRWETCEVQK